MNHFFREFYKNKKILITGHTGFIGSWLSIWLNELGADIVGLALSPHTQKDNYVLSNLDTKIKSVIGDILDYELINELFDIHKFEIVFHLAAQPIVRRSYISPKETYDINVGGTVNIFEAFRNSNSCKVLINVTTDKCYKNQEREQGYTEDDPLEGYDPYSSSKACSELVTSTYRDSFFKKNNKENKVVSSIRVGNVIGGGDWQEDRLIPDCMKAILNNKPVIIRNPKSIRPWQFVLEPIKGMLELTMCMYGGNHDFSGAWNFGPEIDSIFTVEEIICKIIESLGKGQYSCPSHQEDELLHETKILMLDCSKSRQFLKWEPKLSIEDTIKFVCDWYMEENVDYNYNVKQLEMYIDKISG